MIEKTNERAAESWATRLPSGTKDHSYRVADLMKELVGVQPSFPVLYPPIRSDKPILSPGLAGAWDEVDIHSGAVFRDWSGVYRLYYNGQSIAAANHGIGFARSLDGYIFTKNVANPLLLPVAGTWEADYLWKNCTLRLNNVAPWFQMWYGGFNGAVGGIGYAESNNGVNWIKDERNPVLEPSTTGWDSLSIADLRVVYDRLSDKYSGLYYGKRTVLEGSQIGLVRSLDGKEWTRHPRNPVIIQLPNSWEEIEISPKHLLKKGSNWILFYEGISSFNSWLVGIAYSIDLVNWWQDPRNPIFGTGYTGDFDDYYVSDPTVIVDSANPDVLRMYYGAKSAAGNGYVGLALFPLSPKVSGYFRTNWNAWNARVLAGAETSDMVTCEGYTGRTLHFLSDTNGVLTIEHRELDGDWMIYDTQAVVAGTPIIYSLVGDVKALRVSFNVAAIVTAWWGFTA